MREGDDVKSLKNVRQLYRVLQGIGCYAGLKSAIPINATDAKWCESSFCEAGRGHPHPLTRLSEPWSNTTVCYFRVCTCPGHTVLNCAYPGPNTRKLQRTQEHVSACWLQPAFVFPPPPPLSSLPLPLFLPLFIRFLRAASLLRADRNGQPMGLAYDLPQGET